MKMPYIIGITGGSGSGKTSLLKMLRSEFSEDDLAILSQDNYYKKRDDQMLDDAGVKNFDLPDSFLMQEFLADLVKLGEGKPVERTEYTYNNEHATASTLIVKPAPVIIAEGLFIMHIEAIRSALDVSIYVEVNDVLKLKRRILRDRVERNYPLEDVLYRYEHHVLPAYRKFILPHKSDASIIINNNDSMEAAMEVIVGYVRSLLRTNGES